MKKLDLVLLEQEHDAVVVLLDDLVFAREQLGDIDGEALDLDAVLRELVTGVVVVFRGRQHRVGRTGAVIGTGAAERGLAVGRRRFVNARGFQSELGGADRGDITAGTAADDYDVK